MEDQRIYARINVKLSLTFFNRITEKEGAGETLDVSGNGICFISNQKLTPQTPVDLRLNMPGFSEPLYLKGEVVWCKPEEDSGCQKIGVCIGQENEDVISLGMILRLFK